MKKFYKIFVIFSIITISALIFISCATIVTGTTQLVTINSNVEGATIKLDGVYIGKTPFTGEIKKNGDILTIEKKGYKTYSIALSTSLEGMFWGNIITGGTLGSITDFATGAAYKYSPGNYQVELIANGVSIEKFKKIYELKKFAMVNMSNIAIDLSNNKGDYLNSLLYLANLEINEKSIKIVRDILELSEGDQVIFGREIEKLLNN